jgi:uncharacterized protein with ATP-grasp and redox domains
LTLQCMRFDYILLSVMKVQEPCRACLEGLVRKTTALSGDDPGVLDSSLSLLEDLFDADATPPWVADRLLAHIRRRTGVWDPYASVKHREYREAQAAVRGLCGKTDDCLEDFMRLSALGNSTDYFTGGTFTGEVPVLEGDVDRAAAAVSGEHGEILMLGDNIGDFVFDLPLLRFLGRSGRKVFYAVREHPAQNDLSMEDVRRLGLQDLYPRIISTGKANVGLPRESIAGEIERLWKGKGPVIAKGMGNFETISEFDGERQVVYIMKVKCPAVARAVGSDVGTYIAHVR